MMHDEQTPYQMLAQSDRTCDALIYPSRGFPVIRKQANWPILTRSSALNALVLGVLATPIKLDCKKAARPATSATE